MTWFWISLTLVCWKSLKLHSRHTPESDMIFTCMVREARTLSQYGFPFQHLKRPGYNTEFLLYPRPFMWWKYFCCFICFFTFIFAVFILNLLYDFPADIFSLAMNDAVWDVQHTAYITVIRWNVTIYNGRPWLKDWWNFKSYQVPVYEYILSYWVNLEWLAIWSRWQIHIMARQAVKSASKLTNCEHFEY